MRVAYFNELGAYAVAHFKSPCFGYAKYCLPKNAGNCRPTAATCCRT